MKYSILIFIIAFLNFNVFGQEDKTQALARQYFQNGDYKKAAQMFEELYGNNPNNYYYYNSLFTSYIRLNDYNSAEKIVKKQIKKNKDDVKYLVDLGFVYSQDNQSKKAETQFQEAIDKLTANENEIRTLANKFISFRQDEFVIATYEKGNTLLNDETRFAFDLGNAYLRADKPEKAVENWLLVVDKKPFMQQSVQTMFSNNLDQKGLSDALETQLYGYIQKQPSRDEFPEMLIWLFTNQKDFKSALIQAKALDKRKNEDGGRIYKLALDAVQEKEYDAAIDGFEYIVKKGEQYRFYAISKSEILRARKLKITAGKYTEEDLLALQASYNAFLEKYSINPRVAETVRDLANLEARYLFNLDRAIELLEALLEHPQLSKKVRNEVKLDLGDFYLLNGEIWESTLLYAQVDKDEKDSPIGEDARFRNARLSYFKGEFQWAQAQLGILKGATSELVANDALKLSVFIMDNLGLDTTTTTMEMYASAELLAMQNKKDAALIALDKILTQFPNHALVDDIYFKKSTILLTQRKYKKAIENLELLLVNHSEDILADDAIFRIGEIYQKDLNNNEKAMEFYKRIITDFSNSVLVVEARKRFRTLRGDDV
jgi:tetratricopeptide (TPR) repeat protein